MNTFALQQTPLSQCFVWFGNSILSVWNKLDSYVVFNGVTLPRLLLGFIILSAIISVFWKGVRG